MNIANIYPLFEHFKQDNFCLIYDGSFSDEITEMLISLSDNNINNFEELSKIKKKVSFLMAECFQNIVRHAEKPKETEQKEFIPYFFLTRNVQNEYYIASSNLIHKKEVALLHERLNKVNTLGKDQLKALYVEVLNSQNMSAKGGAGLGLIEMARKSGQKLKFDFEDYNDEFSNFYLQVCLKSLEDDSEEHTIPLDETKHVHNEMVENGIFIVHKDNFTQEAIKPALRMVENNFKSQTNVISRKKLTYHIMVEILQNISRHGFRKKEGSEGIFIMGKENNRYIISAGNFIENQKIPDFEKQLIRVNDLTKDQLNDLYLETLREGLMADDNGSGAGLGLIDIARESQGEIEYEFKNIDNNISFFSILVKL